MFRVAVVEWLLCVQWGVWVVSVGGGGVCSLYAASYCTVALNQVDLALFVRRRRSRLVRHRALEDIRAGFEGRLRRRLCLRWSSAGPGWCV